MWLDMYFLWKNLWKRGPSKKGLLGTNRNADPKSMIESREIKPKEWKRVWDTFEQLQYFRKANHIHKWVVDNIQHWKDECSTFLFPLEELKPLYEIAKSILDEEDKKVKKEKANKLLPPSEWFFFWWTEIDEWYFSDLIEFADFYEAMLEAENKGELWQLAYGSSR